jgi:hypothetical protein
VIAIRNGAYSVNDGGTLADQFAGHNTVWNAMRPAMLKFDPVYKDDEAGFCAAYRRSDYAPDLREPWFKEQQAASGGEQPAGEQPAAEQPQQQEQQQSEEAPAKVQPTCTSKRVFLVHLRRPRGLRIKHISVLVDGKRARVLRGKRIRAVVDLRGRGPGMAIVRIVVKGTRGGKKAAYRRTLAYRTCKPENGGGR